MAEKLFEVARRTFDTPRFRGMEFIEVESKSILNHVPGDRFGFNWTINPYRGCQHACEFCYARPTHAYLDMDAGRDFETKIVVKVNAAQLLRKELRAKRWKGELVALGTNTDPYQRAEGRYRLTRQILEVLTEYRNPFSILTKGTLVLRDIDVLQEAVSVTDVSTAFSIPTLDEKVWKRSEPGTPHPRKRLDAVAKLNRAGIPCGVMIAALLPGISDGPEQLEAVTHAAVEAGAIFITPILLHLRPGVKEHYMEWLGRTYPELVPLYAELYPRAYPAAAARKEVAARVATIARDAGFRPRERRPRKVPAPLPRHQQMKLV